MEPGPRAPGTRHLGIADQAAIDSACDGLAKAKQPLALIGLAALRNGVPEQLKSFLEAWQIPFLTTFKAKGVVSERHDLSLGALGLSPIADDVTQKLVQEADHLTLIGFDAMELRDAWLDAWGPDKPCLTLDWATQTDRVFPSGEQLLGDLPANIAQLAASAKPAAAWPESRIDAYRADLQKIVAPRAPETGISPAALFAEVDARLDDNTILTADVGAHRILACHAFNCVMPNQLLQTNGLCSMGYAIPAAVGAALSEPDKRIVALVGDGSALMSLGELAVVAEHQLPVTVIALNDASLALIELKQSKLQVETNAVRFKSPNFCDVAKGFGYEAMRVGSNDEFKAAYEKSRGVNGPVLIEAICDPREYWDQM
ncbi:MAG: thiamine pyrophosphate-dependent enzyme [Pseudomonadota bacterium]